MSDSVVIPLGDRQITIEAGKLAKQADGAVTVRLGDTMILVAAVAASKAREGQEFFPLTVDYRERAAAAGRFPGGFFKREGRPSEKEILTCRLTDRPIRPLFPKGWYNEVQVQSLLLSADGENDPDILSILGASAALTISDIPWDGPLGAVRVGRVDGEFVLNPTHEQREASDLDLIYVGNRTEVVMYEGAAKEISEEDFIQALNFAQEACVPQIEAQVELRGKIGKPKRQVTVTVVPEDILIEAKKLAGERMVPALLIEAKLAREAAVNALFEEIGGQLVAKFGDEKVTPFVLKDLQYYLQKEAVRALILDSGKRLDGRSFDKIRPLHSEVGLVPRAHGSSLFQRGETQALCLTTLGTSEDVQSIDSYTGGVGRKQFILHYNFPNYSVGETGRITGPGRREIGHGALAERSVEPMLPLADYPYAVRITSDILESNGSSSMATVCGASLALMDAGVPLIRPVAGISVGICTEYEGDRIARHQLLTDIIGWEDGFCDMDCKIAGTEQGITGFQLDLKLRGLPLSIMAETIHQARAARLEILEHMASVLPAPREDISKFAPRIISLQINPEKIGMLIGPGGKNIKRIVDESGCEINIEDDGTVKVFSVTPEGMEIARREIEALSAEIEVGKLYKGSVVTLKDFGVFVEVFPGQDGLVHVSELSTKRVNHPEDVVKLGDEIWVKCVGVDEKGRVKLSRKAAMEERGEGVASQAEAAGKSQTESNERPESGNGRSERPSRNDRGDRESKSNSGGRPERGARGDRGGRKEGNDRSEKSERGERGGRNRGDRGRRPERTAPEEGGEEPEVGKLYRAKVTSIKDFGAFVEYIPGREGLVHVSELANFRVKQVEDIVKIDDEIWVKLLGKDDKGRVRLSRRAAVEERDKSEGEALGEVPAPVASDKQSESEEAPSEPTEQASSLTPDESRN